MTSSAVWMERLRSKAMQYKSLTEQSKVARAALLERRYGLDSEEKAALRSCLDHLSEAIPVRDATSMAERLEAIARKITTESGGSINLNFMAAPVHGCFYLSTEMFYVEINIDSAGVVNEAKVHHIDAATPQQQHNNSTNCPELISCLSSGNFSRFVEHLNGLISVYNLPGADAADKSRAWNALTVLEQDLETLYMSCNTRTLDVFGFVHQTPLGLVESRAGGMAMKLRYFVAPHDFLNEATGSLDPFNVEVLTNRDLGHSVTIGLERSDVPRLLSLKSTLMSMNKMDHVNTSVALPAQFVMKLNRPVPLSVAKCREISQLTEIDFVDESNSLPLIQLIVGGVSGKKLDSSNNRGLFVTLPDQQHCYFLTDHPDLRGVMVSSIPFSSARNVPEILTILRQQVLFNTIVASCVRPNSVQDLDRAIMFEVSTLDLSHLTVSYELINEESMATVEFDLSNISNIRCNIYSPGLSLLSYPEELASKIIQKSLSIPITMRSLIRHGQCKIKTDPEQDSNLSSMSTVALSTTATSNINNGRDSNQNFAGSDFASHRFPEVKSEPMDYDMNSSPYANNGNNNSGVGNNLRSDDPLNAFGPQDVTFRPEASVKAEASSQLRNERGTSINDQNSSSHQQQKRYLEDNIKSSSDSSRKSSSSGKSSSSLAIKLPTSSSSVRSTSFKTSLTGVSSSSGTKSGHKSSVSIMPVNSPDSQQTPSPTPKKHGIEIIPLDVSPPDSVESNPPKLWNKDVKRSLSEDDGKRKLSSKDSSSSSSSSSKKRKHDFDRFSGSGHKKSSSPGSPNSKRSLFDGGDKSKKVSSSSNKSSSSSNSGRIKFSTDGASSSVPSSGIEILPAPAGSPPTKSGSSASSSKDRAKSDSPGLKLTIKNSSGGGGSGGSSSKYKSSDHYHKSSSSSGLGSSKSSSSSGSKSSSSSSSKQRPSSSSSSSQQKYSSSHKSSSSSPSSSKHGSSSSSQKPRHGDPSGSSGGSGRDRERDREREEEVKRLLGGGKLNSTFQIPKLSSNKADDSSQNLVTSSTSSTSGGSSSSTTYVSKSGSGYGSVTGSGVSSVRAPTTSPKYPPSTTPTVSPKYPTPGSVSGGGGGGVVVSPRVSPKTTPPGSTPKSDGCGSSGNTPPSLSPKHSAASAPLTALAAFKKTPSSSPTHVSQSGSAPASSGRATDF